MIREISTESGYNEISSNLATEAPMAKKAGLPKTRRSVGTR
jgi:hypothetical protein